MTVKEEVQKKLSYIAITLLKRINNPTELLVFIENNKEEYSIQIDDLNSNQISELMRILQQILKIDCALENTQQEESTITKVVFKDIKSKETKDGLDKVIASLPSLSQYQEEDLLKFLDKPKKPNQNQDNFTSHFHGAQIASGSEHTLLLINGKVFGFGSNVYNQLGLGLKFNKKDTPIPTLFPKSVKKIVKIAAGYDYSIALDDKGDVYGWGSNSGNQLGDLGTALQTTPIKISILDKDGKDQKIADVACGNCHTFFITEDKQVYITGYNSYGQLGTGHNQIVSKPEKLDLSYIVGKREVLSIKIASGISSSTFLTLTTGIDLGNGVTNKETSVYSCGKNGYSQLGLGDASNRYRFELIKELYAIDKSQEIEVIPGFEHTLFLFKDGNVYFVGASPYGQEKVVKKITKLAGIPKDCKVIDAKAGFDHSLLVLLDSDGNKHLYSFGDNIFGQLGTGGGRNNSFIPVKMNLPHGYKNINDINSFSCGARFTVVILGHQIFSTGNNNIGQLGINSGDPFTTSLTAVSLTKDIEIDLQSSPSSFPYETSFVNMNKSPFNQKLDFTIQIMQESKFNWRYSEANILLLDALLEYDSKFKSFSENVRNDLEKLKHQARTSDFEQDPFIYAFYLTNVRDNLLMILQSLMVNASSRSLKKILEGSGREVFLKGCKETGIQRVQDLQKFSLDTPLVKVIEKIKDNTCNLIIAFYNNKNKVKKEIEQLFDIHKDSTGTYQLHEYLVDQMAPNSYCELNPFVFQMYRTYGPDVIPSAITVTITQDVELLRLRYNLCIPTKYNLLKSDKKAEQAFVYKLHVLFEKYGSKALSSSLKKIMEFFNLTDENKKYFQQALNKIESMSFPNQLMQLAQDISKDQKLVRDFSVAFCLAAGFKDLYNPSIFCATLSKYTNAYLTHKVFDYNKFIDQICCNHALDRDTCITILNKAAEVVRIKQAHGTTIVREGGNVIYL